MRLFPEDKSKDIDLGRKKIADKILATMNAYMEKEIDYQLIDKKAIDKIFDWKTGSTVT